MNTNTLYNPIIDNTQLIKKIGTEAKAEKITAALKSIFISIE